MINVKFIKILHCILDLYQTKQQYTSEVFSTLLFQTFFLPCKVPEAIS